MTLIDCDDIATLRTTCTEQELSELQLVKKATIRLGKYLDQRGYHSFEWHKDGLVLHQGRPDFKLMYDEKYRREFTTLTESYKNLLSKCKSLKGVIVDIENRKIDYDFAIGVVEP